LLNDPDFRLEGILSKLLPPEVVLYRASAVRGRGRHRAPDYELWMDRVPDRYRVVVLAVSPFTHFDSNAVMDLEAAIERLHAHHKKLILSGMTTPQFKTLHALGVGRMMDMNNLCPDLEYAIARAMVMLEQLHVGRLSTDAETVPASA
jgi:anti-anti-sigma regulatory factor